MTYVEPLRMRMTRSFSHYTDGVRVYLTIILKIFFALRNVVTYLAPSAWRRWGGRLNAE